MPFYFPAGCIAMLLLCFSYFFPFRERKRTQFVGVNSYLELELTDPLSKQSCHLANNDTAKVETLWKYQNPNKQAPQRRETQTSAFRFGPMPLNMVGLYWCFQFDVLVVTNGSTAWTITYGVAHAYKVHTWYKCVDLEIEISWSQLALSIGSYSQYHCLPFPVCVIPA